jgi:tyrosine-protein kinase Etk/Wzc
VRPEVVYQNPQHAPRPVPSAVRRGSEEQEPGLREYLVICLDARWLILTVTVVVFAAGTLYCLLASPRYLSDVLVQVEQKKTPLAGFDQLASMFDATSPAETEIEILRSRSLLGSVVDELSLDLVAVPLSFPILGQAVARYRDDGQPASALLGLSSFAWGGERIRVDRLQVPWRWEGEALSLVARGAGSYELLDPEGHVMARGEVGKPLAAGEVGLFVSELKAREGTRFRLVRYPRSEVIDALQKDLDIAEKGKQTGIIRVALEGASPARAAAILDAIARSYLRQNVERKSAEAEKTLAFVSAQLPQLKANVDAAEAALKEYRAQRGGGIDLTLETQATLNRATDVEKALTEVELQRSELRQRFTESHPALRALNQKAAQLRREREVLNKQIKGLPETELRAASLMRDAKVANELYVLLLNKAQELQVLKSGTVGNVRILDQALHPRKPASPKPQVVLPLSLLFGVALGTAIAFTRKMLDQGVEDPEVIERETGLPVYAAVPHSTMQAEYSQAFAKRRAPSLPLLAATGPNDLAVEALRSLRASLQFALAEAPNNVVAVGAPTPGVGKTFLTANLAHVLAEAGRRVLLVDGDLRKGRLHHYFGGEKSPGLANLTQGAALAAEAIRKTGQENIHFLPMGEKPPNPSELLSSSRFDALVDWASSRYDIVLIDTAPILAVADGALAGRRAGTFLLALKPGQHSLRELSLTVKCMEQNGVRPRALILNDVKLSAGGYSSYGYHYHEYQ